jgi:prephenate dehydrogenase
MGAWFARFFKSKHYAVTLADRSTRRARLLASKLRVKHAPSNVEAARGSGIVVLATPTNVTPKVIKEILPVLRRNALLCDLSATKSAVMPALRSAQQRGIKVASIHPMFGPLAHGIRGRRILVARTERGTHDYRTVKRLFRGARIHLVDQSIHDKQMALTLGLPHLLNMAFAMTVSR